MQNKFFEGSEKKVELVVSDQAPLLRSLGGEFWARVVAAAQAQILSSFSTPGCDAYLLSESSLFVFDRKVVMITCGATRLVDAVETMLTRISADDVRFFIFERKNELLPAHQPTSFFEDAAALNRSLPGQALRFGHEDEHHIYLYHLDRSYTADDNDVTLELLMHGLGREAMHLFDRRCGAGAESAERDAAIRGILPDYQFADYLFDPTGYSLNAVRGESYATIHVTPEDPGSYASFETNQPFNTSPQALCESVLNLFRPRSFDLVLFERAASVFTTPQGYEARARVSETIQGGYRVRFLSHSRPVAGDARPYPIPFATQAVQRGDS